jgi:Galactose oxidase, central domain
MAVTTSRFLFLSALHLLLAAPVCRAGEIPVNKWTPLGDGVFVRDKTKGPRRNPFGRALLWINSLDSVVLPLPPSRTEGFWKLPLGKPNWIPAPGGFPKGWRLDGVYSHSPKSFVYLPGIKRVLCVMKSQEYTKGPAAGWLLDPANGSWEPLQEAVSLSDKPADFGTAAGRDGERIPRWGAVCYDAHNKEAVHFGGGGTWGRVGKSKQKVKPGDWIFDQTARRIRRLLPEEKGLTEARKWYPGHCGTWLFSEAQKKWRPTKQPLHKQPSGRILPGMAYDAAEKKIVLFGGDDLARCLGDTWVYDCVKRTWSQVTTGQAPSARANHAMVYVPDQKAILLTGGYGGGWVPLKDTWAFRTATGKWTKLGLKVPDGFGMAAGDYDSRNKRVIVAFSASSNPGRRNMPLYSLRLDMATAPRVAPQRTDPMKDWHCKVRKFMGVGSMLPDEWGRGINKPGDPARGRRELAALPANTWVKRKPPINVPGRGWGSYVYDVKSHKGFAWGGGHSAYPGADISSYDLLTNRWSGMAQPTNYNPIWLHGMVGGPPGVSFAGWSLLPSHARKSYGVDPLSGSVITYAGDVYSIKHRSVISHMAPFPVRFGRNEKQGAYVTTSHGLYAFAHAWSGAGALCRANVAKGTWEVISKLGRKVENRPWHEEHSFLCWDSKRDRLLYFGRKGAVLWTFDFKSKKWATEKPAGKSPAKALGDATYIPEMDAVLMIFSEAPKRPEKLWFYRCAERKWYTAPYVGDVPKYVNAAGRDWSPIYDPKLKLVVRLHPDGNYGRWTGVTVMRLEPGSLKLTSLHP